MKPEIRIYTLPGCPHCEAAGQYFKDRDIPVETVVLDQLLLAAIPKALQMPQIQVPIVSFTKQNALVIGFKPQDYAHLLNSNAGDDVSPEIPTNVVAAEPTPHLV